MAHQDLKGSLHKRKSGLLNCHPCACAHRAHKDQASMTLTKMASAHHTDRAMKTKKKESKPKGERSFKPTANSYLQTESGETLMRSQQNK